MIQDSEGCSWAYWVLGQVAGCFVKGGCHQGLGQCWAAKRAGSLQRSAGHIDKLEASEVEEPTILDARTGSRQ